MEEEKMLKRILACLFTLAALPLMASTAHNNSAPFASVAFAGHVFPGSYACSCGTPGCIEDYPGECGQINRAISDKNNQDASPVGLAPTPGLDFGSSAMVLALALFVWARFLRA